MSSPRAVLCRQTPEPRLARGVRTGGLCFVVVALLAFAAATSVGAQDEGPSPVRVERSSASWMLGSTSVDASLRLTRASRAWTGGVEVDRGWYRSGRRVAAERVVAGLAWPQREGASAVLNEAHAEQLTRSWLAEWPDSMDLTARFALPAGARRPPGELEIRLVVDGQRRSLRMPIQVTIGVMQ